MDLFINQDEHPDVFKNSEHLPNPNQDYFHQDKFSDMIHEQQALNQTLTAAYAELKNIYQRQQQDNRDTWQHVNEQLHKLNDQNQKQQTFAREIATRMEKLEENNRELQRLMDHDETMVQNVAEQVAALHMENESILSQLTAYEASQKHISQEINKLSDMNQSITNQLTEHDNAQDDMLSRLGNQEAVMAKIHRQISELRAILYERSSYLAEKIEDSYNVTSSYVYKLITGTDKPVMWYMDQKNTDNQNQDTK